MYTCMCTHGSLCADTYTYFVILGWSELGTGRHNASSPTSSSQPAPCQEEMLSLKTTHIHSSYTHTHTYVRMYCPEYHSNVMYLRTYVKCGENMIPWARARAEITAGHWDIKHMNVDRELAKPSQPWKHNMTNQSEILICSSARARVYALE